jgi:hypothetical protein
MRDVSGFTGAAPCVAQLSWLRRDLESPPSRHSGGAPAAPGWSGLIG